MGTYTQRQANRTTGRQGYRQGDRQAPKHPGRQAATLGRPCGTPAQ